MSQEVAGISVVTEQERCTLRLSGVLGAGEAEELHRAAIELYGIGKDARIDWSEAVRIDACILQVVLSLGAGLSAAGRSLSGTSAKPEVAAYLRTAGLPSILDEVRAR